MNYIKDVLNFMFGRLIATILLIGLIILFGGNPWAVAISFIGIALIWMFSR